MAVDRLVVDWTDVNGAFARTAWYLAAGGSPAALLTAIAAAQNGTAQIIVQGPTTFGTTSPADAQFASVLDLAVLNFVTSAGTGIQLQIPAPLTSDFLPSARLVAPLDPNIAAVIAASIGLLTDNLGNPVTAFASGSYASRRKEQS